MARSQGYANDIILLGYEDEVITEKHTRLVGYWTNKIGGIPDWCVDGVQNPLCQLCGLRQLLVVQVYAPLEGSNYHRTIYVFCCINPNCINHSQSWTCRRGQLIDTENNETAALDSVRNDWCAGAADWDDDNGNTLPVLGVTNTDSDDSSSLSTAFGTLSVDQCNANWGASKGSGAVGKINATAEIEGDEGEVVSIDTPTRPQHDLVALLEATAPLPNFQTVTAFVPSFMWVGEEGNIGEASEYERGLLAEYQAQHGEISQSVASGSMRNHGEEEEKYEKGLPAHGDAMFHEFISRIQSNPGQVLRYCRESVPLLLAPFEVPRSCRYCQGDVIFEMQLLPTLVNKLRLPGDTESHVEFGNVLIYTCKESCWGPSDTHRDETVCVQAESIPLRRQ